MKITHNKVGQNLNTADAQKSDAAGKSEKSKASAPTPSLLETKSGGATHVDLSERAQDMKKIKEAALAAPDVDAAKVAHFQKMIDDGKYKVDSEAVADRMVDEHLAFS